jgi:hypothetical protein
MSIFRVGLKELHTCPVDMLCMTENTYFTAAVTDETAQIHFFRTRKWTPLIKIIHSTV